MTAPGPKAKRLTVAVSLTQEQINSLDTLADGLGLPRSRALSLLIERYAPRMLEHMRALGPEGR